MQDSFKQYGLCLMVMCALVLFCAVPAEAKGAVEDADFSYRGISLGDTEQTLREKWGAKSLERDVSIQ